MPEPYDLERFVDAQRDTLERALEELRAGHKSTHWMWFIFPQLAGLGQSEMAWRYGVSDVKEAQAYWRHALLGAHLRECIEAVLPYAGRGARQVFGAPDDLKFRSSMTLFREAEPNETIFQQALDAFFAGEPDPRTISMLGDHG
ncbi:DUF1810 domain-containing protein [Pseudomonas matsuisoli]|uniref:Calpastatin n=1 Tax=Pseudomonas matsuisoli TaxID=1515666 RepID=A0A917Q0L1_9PSED|nr:DUF1810 domain-containing protein [Pseudomonas matsuisoli]GGK05183.1 hypothetical protein GCM10009304_34110 [Pseudomonas matsuisoli]